MNQTDIDPETLARAIQFLQQERQPQPSQPAPPVQQGPSTNPPAPPISRYVSSRLFPPSTQGHPNPTTPAPPSFSGRSILGASSLAVSMAGNTNQPRSAGGPRLADRPTRSDISQANMNRNEAIQAHFPRPPSLPIRTRRRGRGHPTPTLPPDDTSPESVFETDSITSEEFIHLETHVHLPTVGLSFYDRAIC